MKTMSIRRRIAALALLACCGTVLAAASSQAAATGALAGKWTGHYGGAYSGHFTIHWKQSGSRLHGSITLSSPSGTYSISGSVKNGKIKFGAVSAGAKYKGTVHGSSMSGTWTSPQGGGSWNAAKAANSARAIGLAVGQPPCPAPPLTEPGAAAPHASRAMPSHDARTAANVPAAKPTTGAKFAQSVLAKGVVPPHSKVTTRLGGATQEQSVAMKLGIKGLTDLSRAYAVSWPVSRVVAFEKSHIPGGTHLLGTGTNCLNGNNSSFEMLSVPVSGIHEFNGTLTIGMESTGAKTTLLRFDAQTSWVPSRPKSEVPPNGATLKLTVFNASPAVGNYTETLSAQQQKQVTSQLNSLPLAPAADCAQSAPIYELQYTGAPSSFDATGYECGGTVLISGAGKSESPLHDPSYKLIGLLQTYVPKGISLKPSNGTSTNWAGWANALPPSPHLYQTVSANWTVPKVSCGFLESSSAVEWVGIDGTGNGNVTVEQDGTSTQCIGGSGTYLAWWELYGSSVANGYQVNLPGYDHVYPGDRMTVATIAGQGSGGPGYTVPAPPAGSYLFTITNLTEHWSWYVIAGPVNSHPFQSTAEWITEQNSCFWVCNSLANYGTVNYTSMRVGDNTFAFPFGALTTPASEPGGEEIDLIAGPTLKETGSPLGAGGDSETTTWFHG
jgi:hypothetical protein